MQLLGFLWPKSFRVFRGKIWLLRLFDLLAGAPALQIGSHGDLAVESLASKLLQIDRALSAFDGKKVRPAEEK